MMTRYRLIITTLLLSTLITNSQAQVGSTDNYFETSKNLDIYYALLKEVNQLYVDPIQPGKMVKNSIDAMLDKLDPYTNYITEDDIEDYRFQTTGKYGGIGTGIRQIGDNIVIDEPYENSPASKAGLKSGDIIIAIDGKSAKGLNDEQVRKLVKGSPGSVVKFTVRNPFTNAESVKTLTRDEININNVSHSQLLGTSNSIAYVRMTQFTANCTNNVKQALDSLKTKANGKLTGVILDLRSNPGGLLDESVSLCNLFVNREQLVVSTKGKVEEWVKEYKTRNMAWDESIPVVVLINRSSASASEIVSGTLQDLDRGVIIGQKSFGKGLVQTTRDLPFNSKVKITTAKYYIPSGRCIQALDYTHRNSDGSVGEVPDSIKKEFKTKGGRKVYDGGGVEPDIKTATKESNRLINYLLSDHHIFNYANEYAHKHPSLSASSAEQFTLNDTDVDAFITWLGTQKFTYKTKTQETLDKLKTNAEKENVFAQLQAQYDAINNTLDQEKAKELQKAKSDIKAVLQSEIVTRYYYQKGRVQNELSTDVDILEAIKVLSSTAAYNKVLGKQ
jgi:carboxyl-terminal processing protease